MVVYLSLQSLFHVPFYTIWYDLEKLEDYYLEELTDNLHSCNSREDILYLDIKVCSNEN